MSPRIFKLYCITILFSIGTAFNSCINNSTSENNSENKTLTALQEKLISEGWYVPNSQYSGELPDMLGIMSVYGQYDNYFDIEMGSGCDVAIKIINKKTDNCIRYVYVPENTMVNIQMIPQGEYYLKLAYGSGWMEFETDDGSINGKFTDDVSYEKSVDTFDFGVKNSNDIISNILRINVKDKEVLHNFNTIGISEEEFMK